MDADFEFQRRHSLLVRLYSFFYRKSIQKCFLENWGSHKLTTTSQSEVLLIWMFHPAKHQGGSEHMAVLCWQGTEKRIEGGKWEVLAYFPTLNFLLLEYRGVLEEAAQSSDVDSVSPFLSFCLLSPGKSRGIDKHWETRNVLLQQNATLQILQDRMWKGKMKI